MATTVPTESPELRLDLGLHITPYGDDELFVRRGSRSPFSKVIRDDARRGLLAGVVQTLRTTQRVEDVVAALDADADAVSEIVDLLREHDVLLRAPDADTAAAAPAATVLGHGPLLHAVHRLLDEEGLATTLAPVEPADAATEDAVVLAAVERAAAEGELLVLATTHLRPGLSLRVNELGVEHRVPVLHVCLDGPEARIGPVVVPGQTACYACWETQDEGSRHLRHDFLAYKDRLERVPSEAHARPAVVHLAAAWAALAARDAASGRSTFLHGRSVRIETERSEVVGHRILQLPRCPVCSRARHDLRHAFL